MRQFSSYGPVDARHNFCVERTDLVDRCVNQLVGEPDEGGHYFTIWAARQTGKTWLMRQALQEIPKRYGDKFALLSFSLGGLRGMPFNPPLESAKTFMPEEFGTLFQRVLPGTPIVKDWDDFLNFFSKKSSILDRPLIMLIDEIDTVSSTLLDLMVGRFRELYLYNRSTHWLHGLALIGVRAVIGIESQRGSPFNVQRSLHVPNLTHEEVVDMYQQYQTESGQAIDPAVVEKVYEMTRGQPGLVSWFGELLTEKYNHGKDKTIDLHTWLRVWNASRFLEPNNTVMNLIAKARMGEYQDFLLNLFSHADIPFSFHDPLHNYLYMHGVIEPETTEESPGQFANLCRFTSPFIQDCVYEALGKEFVGSAPILALNPLDRLDDVFHLPILNLPALLQRYKDYLVRLKAKGINPWKAQPRRETDIQLTEAVGHFHLYAWLQQAIGRRAVVSPEFPTGNGKVDLHIRYESKQGLIEVKSFVDTYQLDKDKLKTATYAKQVGLNEVTMAVFIPVLDEEVLAKLSTTETHDGVQVTVVMIGWF